MAELQELPVTNEAYEQINPKMRRTRVYSAKRVARFDKLQIDQQRAFWQIR